MKTRTRGATSLTVAATGILAALVICFGQDASAARIAPERSLPQAYLLKLDEASTLRTFRQNRDEGLRAAKLAARDQKSEVSRAQNEVIDELPAEASVIYRTHSVLAGVGVSANAEDKDQLGRIPGVRAVYPVAPKQLSNSSAVPLQAAPAAWQATGFLGQGQRIAVIDTGLDYTHSSFGGPGTTAAYDEAHAAGDQPPDPDLFSADKLVGGIDLVGDDYNASPGEGFQPVPHPDPNPIDCEGHGSHVSGSAAGYGVKVDGSTYDGGYDDTTDFAGLKIGPGMAPEAGIYAIKVFGCEGSTNVVAEAIDHAVDPNGDGDPSDRVDVINLSLGSDFGSVQDGDSVAANAAAALGVSVVAAAGNSGDHTDISGSPGDASRVLSVASTVDADSKIDGAEVTIDGNPGLHGVTRSVQYDWKAGPDLSGPVVAAPPENATACAPYAGTPFTGKVVLVDWHDAAPECSSALRGDNLAAAGAAGFIFGSDSESFSAGINGDDEIPGVLMVASGTEAIRDGLDGNLDVTVDGTVVNAVTQSFPENVDKVSGFSSRGIHATGNVKPDVSAVGSSVFSVAVGAGSEGTSNSGTSMASPMVAGLAALVRQANPGWSPLQVKADIMNTAGHDLYVGGAADPASNRYGPPRVGAGRIDAADAVANGVLAYDPANGAVSVSFGPVEVSGAVSLDREVTVDNQSAAAATYAASYDPINEVPGAKFTVSPAGVTLEPGAKATLTISLEIEDPTRLTKAVDPTVGRLGESGYPRETLAESFGRLLLEPTGSGPDLRVPVYASPRPAAEMTQPDSLAIHHNAASADAPEQVATFALAGNGLGTGSGENGEGDGDPGNDILSIAAGFELQATSGQSPECGGAIETSCWRLPEERYADLAMVGYTSDAPLVEDPADARAFFAVAVHQPWAIPANKGQIWISLDLDDDLSPDLFVYNSRLDEDDIFVSALYDPAQPAGERVVDVQLVNGRFGNLDSALYDSDVMVLPVSLAKLAEYGVNAENPRVNYGIEGYSYFSSQAIDAIGVNAKTGDLEDPLSANFHEPGITVADRDGDGPLVEDQPGDELTVTRNIASWNEDRGRGVMMVHFHNRVGEKAQALALHGAPSSIAVTVTAGQLTARVSAVRSDMHVPRGEVTFLVDGVEVGKSPLADGTAELPYVVPTGATRTIVAEYPGDIDFEPSSGQVQRSDPLLTARVRSNGKKNRFGWYREPVTVRFNCTTRGSELAAACPATLRLKGNRRGERVHRSIRALDGGRASVVVRGIRIDRTPPTLRIRGIRRGASYHRIRRVRCVARDRTSGVLRCVTRLKRIGKRVIYVTTATDKAGNQKKIRSWIRLRHQAAGR